MYEYIGRLNVGGKISPIYRKRKEKNELRHDLWLINEWKSSQKGFDGWIGTVRVIFIKFQVINIEKIEKHVFWYIYKVKLHC